MNKHSCPKPRIHWAQRLAIIFGVCFSGTLLAQTIELRLLTQKGTWPGHARGEPCSIAVSSNYAYLTTIRGGLMILDLSNPVQPLPVGDYHTGGSALDVAVSGKYAYVVGEHSLQVVDVSSPAKPRCAGRCDLGKDSVPSRVVVHGTCAYVMQMGNVRGSSSLEGSMMMNGTIQVIDISDPTTPHFLAKINAEDWIDGVPNSPNLDYRKEGNVWIVYDRSNPGNPMRLGPYEAIASAFGIVVSGHYAYVSRGDGSLKVIDISDPSQPKTESVINTIVFPPGVRSSTSGNRLALSGNHLYMIHSQRFHEHAHAPWVHRPFVRSMGYWLRVFDLKNPEKPLLVGSHETLLHNENPTQTEPWRTANLGYDHVYRDLAVSGKYVYLINIVPGLEIIDVSEPTQPIQVGTYNTGSGHWAWDVVRAGRYAYIADGTAGLEVIDIAHPVMPVRVGGFNNFTNLMAYGAKKLALAGHYAYVVDDTMRLQVVDVSDPAEPVLAGDYVTGSRFHDVEVANGYAYLTTVAERDYVDGPIERGSLLVLDLSVPTIPIPVGCCDTTTYAPDVAVQGTYAYVLGGQTRPGQKWVTSLEVIDVGNPERPIRMGQCEVVGTPMAVAVAGSFAYVAAWDRGLVVIDVSDPANPRRVASCETFRQASGVRISGNYAYVADGSAGVQRLDIRNPLAPTWLGSCQDGGFATAADVSGDFVYVADGQRGLTVLELMPLHIQCQSDQLEMTWPMTTMDWALYSATDLNRAEWIRVSGESALADGNCRVTLPHTKTSSRFFCLKAGGKSAN